MLSVLVVSPHPSVPGGVSVFIECMKRHVSGSRVDSFYVGSSGRESVWQIAKRLIVGPVALARRVRRQHYDVVHINPSFDVKSLIRDGLFVLALRAIGYRHILFYVHGWDAGVQQRILHNAFLRRVVAWVLNQTALITVLGNDFRDGLIALGVEPARVVVTRTMFEWRGLHGKARAEFVWPPLRRSILFMSRFDREKGGRELVQAFASIAKDYADLDLIMAGKGEEAEALQAHVSAAGLSERVIFTGYISGNEKWKRLRECTIFALPTYYRSEGMPVAMLEAMGAGKPLLIGSAGAISSVVSDPENGVVLDAVTPQTIEAGLRRLLDDPAFMKAAGQRNSQIALNKFAADIVTPEIENMYRRVASC